MNDLVLRPINIAAVQVTVLHPDEVCHEALKELGTDLDGCLDSFFASQFSGVTKRRINVLQAELSRKSLKHITGILQCIIANEFFRDSLYGNVLSKTFNNL